MKSKRILVVVCLVSAGATCYVSLTVVREHPIQEDALGRLGSRRADCGPACLYVACKLMGKEETFSNICQKAQLTDKGTSMLNLKVTASDLGFDVEARKASVEWLSSTPVEKGRCFVLYVRPQHFILVQRIGGKTPLVIFDPNFDRPFVVEDAFLTSNYHWSGELLVLKA